MKGYLRINGLHLYGEGLITDLGVHEIIGYLGRWMTGSHIEFRGNFFRYHLSSLTEEERRERAQQLAEELAFLRIRDATRRDLGNRRPMEAEVSYEKRRIEKEDFRSFGILYDGFGLQGIFSSLISEDERGLSHCHIIFTNQLLGTWDDDDRRYHARVSVYGFPSIISTTGVVEPVLEQARPSQPGDLRRQSSKVPLKKRWAHPQLEVSRRFCEKKDLHARSMNG